MNTTYALGEVQTPGAQTPWTRHAVAEARPGDWARAVCPAEPLVWVHELAGEPVPFPSYSESLAAGEACPDCVAHVRADKRH